MGKSDMDTNSSKIDNQLNVALDVGEVERERTMDLDVGFDAENQTWELIVKYSGNLDRIREELQISVVELMGEYAIITIPENKIALLSQYQEIEFIEKPKRLFFSVIDGIAVSCLLPLQDERQSFLLQPTQGQSSFVQSSQGESLVRNQLQGRNKNLSGQGVIVAIIDSGIDYSHPDFRNTDGTTRILYLWDQTIAGNPPEGYRNGTLYTSQDINEALSQEERAEQLRQYPRGVVYAPGFFLIKINFHQAGANVPQYNYERKDTRAK